MNIYFILYSKDHCGFNLLRSGCFTVFIFLYYKLSPFNFWTTEIKIKDSELYFNYIFFTDLKFLHSLLKYYLTAVRGGNKKLKICLYEIILVTLYLVSQL